ncbi:TonB-dependent siderophore receptor [Ideonella sp. BN130291]|uniref:TonB-dependent siderophore receptor n=1 Tax=Ideonella sp. BN130291 TaxID=3112940 RepID=UPI002E25915B|nr:TonB-dependent siderophore receptor [Ideonella sp. BN130291]
MTKPVLFCSLSLLCALAATAAEPVQQVTVTGRIIGSPLQVGGFGDVPLAQSPFAASLITASQLADAGARGISDLTRLDAAISDAYNAEGYWQSLTVRGFVIDNRFNYRRDGLPINAEAVIPLGNKQGVELLKGTTGIQAGTSAPGGLVNLVVKRPTRNLRTAGIEWREHGSVGGAVDISQRFGTDEAFGLRVNASAEHLDPQVRSAKGERHLLALAGDWRVSPDTLIEAEVENSRQSQPSVPGFSLLGSTLPDARSIDPRINLNNQSWSLPVVFKANTGSLRLQQRLNDDWRITAQAMAQRLVNDDRVAFPFGCSAADVYDRYCSDGSFDLYDFRSENEHRDSDAVDLALHGALRTGGVSHQLSAGVLFTRFQSRFQRQAYNWAGVGTIDGNTQVPAAPELTDENTNRDERSTELYLRDAIELSPQWSVWAGLRHTRLARESVRTDGSRATSYDQQFTTPWLAVAHRITPKTLVYASWGQGIESAVVPNRSYYTNAGEALPALKSRQVELGLKHDGENIDASAALFDIDRPQVAEESCSTEAPCTGHIDGSARHRGAEAMLSWHSGPWQVHGTGMWLDAKRRGAQDASVNGLRPTNVAARTLRLQVEHDLGALPGLHLLGSVVHEGDRMVLPDNSLRIPAWTRLDLLARYEHTLGGTQLTWRVGVDNATNQRAWKEAPYQYGHAYLFPMAPRTLRVALQAAI